MAMKARRSLSELVALLKSNPGALTPQELRFVRAEVKKMRGGQAARGDGEAYAQHKRRTAERQRVKARAGQNIGPPPAPKNPPRKAAACASLRVFCETYFRHKFYFAWSADHLEVIARIEEAVLHGGLYALAMPRKSGKTSLVEIACLWAALIGAHKFILLIGASRDAALELLQSIKEEISSNEILYDDFPEVCFPIGELEDRANRCKGQHIDGAKTKSVWSTDKIVLPTVAGSLASGAIIRVTGITGRIRGAKKDVQRPSLCILDDPQTDASAGSASQCIKRQRIISGAVLGLAGPGKKITAICPCTVIARGDLADSLLDREKNPLWTGKRYCMLQAFPTNMGLWEEYAVMRADEFRNGGDGLSATGFYASNRAAMDHGAVVGWQDNFEPGELSGVQHAMNLFQADKWAFWSEYQNQPLAEDFGEGQLDAQKVAARVNSLEESIVPLNASIITVGVDVGKNVLWYVVTAWEPSTFTGAVIQYGAWPEQDRPYFTNTDARRTLAHLFPGAEVEASIQGGLTSLAERLLAREWRNEAGTPMKVALQLVDSKWKPDTVQEWARRTPHAANVLASQGRYVGAKAAKMWHQYERRPGERLGLHWLIGPVATSKRATRVAAIDVNFWKTTIAQKLALPVGNKGAITLYGRAGQDHRLFADHCTAQYFVDVSANGRTVREWMVRPDRKDQDHLWDCLVYATAAASIQGAVLPATGTEAAGKKRVTFAELQAASQKRAI